MRSRENYTFGPHFNILTTSVFVLQERLPSVLPPIANYLITQNNAFLLTQNLKNLIAQNQG